MVKIMDLAPPENEKARFGPFLFRWWEIRCWIVVSDAAAVGAIEWLRWWEDLVGGVVSTVGGALDQGGRARVRCVFPAPVASIQSTR